MTRALLATAFLLTASSAVAEPFVIECPALLTVQETPRAIPSPWEKVAGTPEHHFENVGVFDGHPRDRASLKPDDEDDSGSDFSAVWSFASGTKNIWVGCYYFGTTVLLARRVPDNLSRCTAIYRRQGTATFAERKVVCE